MPAPIRQRLTPVASPKRFGSTFEPPRGDAQFMQASYDPALETVGWRNGADRSK